MPGATGGGERTACKVVSAEPRRPRYETPMSGELLRSLFEDKLDSREPEAA